MKTTDIRLALLLALLLVLPLQGQAQEEHKANPGSPQTTALYPKAPNTIRLVSYNVGAFTKYTSGSYAPITRMMLELDADAVALQELDSCTTRTGGIFQIDRLARLMKWHYAYAPAMPYRGGSYGIGVVCRNRIGHHYAIALPPGGEPRTVAVVELDDCIVASTHLDLQAETQVREAEYINRIFSERYGESDKPVFLLGDLNAQPDSPTLQTLKQHWTVLSVEGNTYSSRKPQMCIDYVLQLNNGVPCRVTDSQIATRFHSGDVTQTSDHLPLYVDVELSDDRPDSRDR